MIPMAFQFPDYHVDLFTEVDASRDGEGHIQLRVGPMNMIGGLKPGTRLHQVRFSHAADQAHGRAGKWSEPRDYEIEEAKDRPGKQTVVRMREVDREAKNDAYL